MWTSNLGFIVMKKRQLIVSMPSMKEEMAKMYPSLVSCWMDWQQN